jgi:flagellar secretion chaperone FliS
MKTPVKQYQESQILTAPKEELLLMLLDGASRFAEQGRARMVEKKYDESCKLYIRAQRIMIELITSLDSKVIEKSVYDNLVGLYYFVYWRLVRANTSHDPALIDEALRILQHLRETWALAIDKLRKESHPQAALVDKAQKAGVSPAPPPPPANIDLST